MGSLDRWQSASNTPLNLSDDLELWNKSKCLQPQTTPVMYCQQEGVVNRRLDMLTQRIDSLESKLDLILSKLDGLESFKDEDDVVELRDIPKEQAKIEIKEFFAQHHGENLYASDIEEKLLIDFDLIMECMGELERDGEIREA